MREDRRGRCSGKRLSDRRCFTSRTALGGAGSESAGSRRRSYIAMSARASRAGEQRDRLDLVRRLGLGEPKEPATETLAREVRCDHQPPDVPCRALPSSAVQRPPVGPTRRTVQVIHSASHARTSSRDSCSAATSSVSLAMASSTQQHRWSTQGARGIVWARSREQSARNWKTVVGHRWSISTVGSATLSVRRSPWLSERRQQRPCPPRSCAGNRRTRGSMGVRACGVAEIGSDAQAESPRHRARVGSASASSGSCAARLRRRAR